MKGFFLGIAVAALATGVYLVWKDPSLLSGPRVATPSVDAAAATSAKKKKKRMRGAVALARSSAHEEARAGAAAAGPLAQRVRSPAPASVPEPEARSEPEPEPVHLTAADLRSVGQGDDLSRPDVVHLDMAAKESSDRELSQDDIDSVFRAQENAILECISTARPDPEAYVPGRVTIKFRIQRTGGVRGVRVEGPAILHKGGLYTCIRSIIARLKFGDSGSSQIVTYPFTLN